MEQTLNNRPASPSSAPLSLKPYLVLTKPMLNTLVVLTCAAGFALGSAGPVDWLRLGWSVTGTMLAALAAAALNQWLERGPDALMRRTQGRPLPRGQIAPGQAFALGLALALSGIGLLAWQVNVLAAFLAAATLCIYLFIYTPLKRHSTLCTIVGAVSGAIPPLIGYAGARGYLDYGAWTLFVLMFVWQIPHFLALAWRFREDYAQGGFRMLPGADRDGALNANMLLLYSVALLPLGLAPALAGLAGAAYVLTSVALGLGLIALAINQHVKRTFASARMVFMASVLYLPVLFGVMLADHNTGPVAATPAVAAVAAIADRAAAPPVTQLNGFALDRALVPVDAIQAGALRDAIPALVDPEYLDTATAEARNHGTHGNGKFLVGSDRVIGVTIGDDARAYPLRFLNWHEVVNDTLGGEPLCITYSPLSDGAVVFQRTIGDTERTFGVSGLLFNSNLLLYDHVPAGEPSLWSQLQLRAVSGPAAEAGQVLAPVACELTYWEDWRARYPETTVITGDPSISQRYKRDPYGHYFETGKLMFPASPAPPADSLPLMTRIVAIESGGTWQTYAYELPSLSYRAGPRELIDEVAGIRLELLPRAAGIAPCVVRVTRLADGKPLKATYALWFAWYALHNGAELPDLRLLDGQWP
ncbi:protoheme IX farnesyltransferase [bacterium]|nr:protoheme IX farnesyltransferase [bacterium]